MNRETVQKDSLTVLGALTTLYEKTKPFIYEVAEIFKIPSEDRIKLDRALSLDILVHVGMIKHFLKTYESALAKQEVGIFRALLPDHMKDVVIEKKISDKGFLILKCFDQILKDLEKAQ